MRRLLALAALAAAVTGGPAAAEPDCYGVVAGGTEAGVCVEYVCVDICAPEYHVDPYCRTDVPLATCRLVDRLYVVVP